MEYRFLLTSDLHYSGEQGIYDPQGRRYDYGESADARMQMWMELILSEHEKQALDAVFILGDAAHEKAENLKNFMERYADRLPCKVYLLPGNHEAFSQEAWSVLTGCERQYAVDFPNCRFLMTDCFYDLSHPHRLQDASLEFLRKEFASSSKTTFLCTHFMRPNAECAALLSEQESLKAVFHGHTHSSYPIMQSMGGKPVISTGNFSYFLPTAEGEEKWAEKWGMSMTELCLSGGEWTVRKLYPEMCYPFSALVPPNRFAGYAMEDCKVERSCSESFLLK